MSAQPFEDPNATFIRGITYRSTDSFRFAEIHKEITDLKKAATKKENEKKEMADVVEQDRLIELKGASASLSGVRETWLTSSTVLGRQATGQAHRRSGSTIL